MCKRGYTIGFVLLSLSLSSVINFFGKTFQTGDLEATTISEQEVNAEFRDTLACLYLI